MKSYQMKEKEEYMIKLGKHSKTLILVSKMRIFSMPLEAVDSRVRMGEIWDFNLFLKIYLVLGIARGLNGKTKLKKLY